MAKLIPHTAETPRKFPTSEVNEMKKEYIKPQAMLVETLDSYCELNLEGISGYGADHTIIIDGL